MIQVIADERDSKSRFYPFASTRELIDMRLGILTIREKWQKLVGGQVVFVEEGVPGAISSLQIPISGQSFNPASPSTRLLEKPTQLFEYNDWAIRQDFDLLTDGRKSAPIPPTVVAIQPENIFIEEGAKLSHCILNATTGPIYIGRDSEIMEGSLIRGPFALCEAGVVKMGTKIYGATTIGPACVVGGEIKNSVFFGYSNKAHDGYLGDSVIAEWCNLGAGTSNSNIRNTASDVKVWNRQMGSYETVGLKCGLLMGDYSRAAINTSFNTATVVGIASNVFCAGLTPKYIPDFSWGDGTGERYLIEKAIEDIKNWKKLKNKELTEKEIQILKSTFEHTKNKI